MNAARITMEEARVVRVNDEGYNQHLNLLR